MRLDDCFERIVVINLGSKSDRRRRLAEHFATNGIVDPARLV